MPEYTNTACTLYDTDYCRILAANSCSECYISRVDAQEAQRARTDIDVACSLLPGGSVSELFESETCLFCKGEARKKKYYALTDYAHEKPERKKTSLIGMKMKSKVGTLIPLQIACCEQCKKNITWAEYLSFGITCVGVAVSLAVLSLQPVREWLASVSEIVPLAIFVAAAAVSFILGKYISTSFRKKKGVETEFDANDLSYIKKMIENGWFCATDDKHAPRLIFSKERLKRGWFTR